MVPRAPALRPDERTSNGPPSEHLTRHLRALISRSGAGRVPEDLANAPPDPYLIAEAPAQLTGKRLLAGHQLAPLTAVCVPDGVDGKTVQTRMLREHGIEVTAIHNHMLDDQPHLYFMHFWANDDARKLAEGLKAALAQINIVKS